jgi:hypothetical protein
MKFLRLFAILCLAVSLALWCGLLHARQLGDMEDDRWVYIAGSSNGAELFVDGQSIAYEKQFDAWACWVRILDPTRDEESIVKYLFRNHGQEMAIIAAVIYDTKTKDPAPKHRSDAIGSPKWRAVVPDSFADNVWEAIKLKTSTK